MFSNFRLALDMATEHTAANQIMTQVLRDVPRHAAVMA